jgi:phage gp36-like protein
MAITQPLPQAQYAFADDFAAMGVTAAWVQRFGPAAINAQLKAASSFCDSYLASQFTLPLQLEPPGWDMSLTKVVCDIAAYQLSMQYGFNPAAPQDDLLVTRYKAAVAWLEAIRDKELFPQWVDSSPAPLTGDEGGPWAVSDPPKGFTGRGLSPFGPWVPGSGFNPRGGNG